MSRFKIIIEKKGSSDKEKVKAIYSSEKKIVIGKKYIAVASGIEKYDKELIVKKINLMSNYLDKEKSVTISKEKVKQILETTK